MDTTLINEYKKLRSQNVLAKYAFDLVKVRRKNRTTFPIDTFFNQDGFDIIIKVEHDDIVDISPFGRFTDHVTDQYRTYAIVINRNNPRQYKYFVPSCSFSEHKSYFHSVGFSKNDATIKARQCVMDDYELAKNYNPLLAIVHVYKNGINIASTTIGGIDKYDDVSDTLVDCGTVDEAIDLAKNNIKKLCDCSIES